MKSRLFEVMGMGNLDIAYLFIALFIILLILIILMIVQMVKTNKLKKKYEKFMRGKEAKSLEKEIIGLYEDNRFLKLTVSKNEEDIKQLFRKFRSAFQKSGLVKYDAFNQMGGQLSFSLALLDEKDNGFIINSVHSTEGCYSYTKEIKNGQCSISLGEEEKQALDIAMGR